jgi:hypothetical protein
MLTERQQMARALALSAKEAGGEVDPKEDDDVKQHAGLFSMLEELESMQQRQTAAHRQKSYRASADGTIERIESAELNEAEVSHFLYFSLCLIRDQCKLFLAAEDLERFDEHLANTDTEFGGKDVISMDGVMGAFRQSLATREGWMPFHACLGSSEMYLFALREDPAYEAMVPEQPAEQAATLPPAAVRSYLSRAHRVRGLVAAGIIDDVEVYALQFAFRASSLIPLFDSLIMSLFFEPGAETPGHPAHTRWKQVLGNPQVAFARGGDMHEAFRTYRQRGEKLHTTSYRCVAHGCSGENFTFFITERTGIMIALASKVHALIKPHLQSTGGELKNEMKNVDSSALFEKIDQLVCSYPFVGPTMSKTVMLTTHLHFPGLRLLDHR